MIKKTRVRQMAHLESLERRDLLSVTPQLVGDFNRGAPDIRLQTDNARLGNEVFFAADDGRGDVELWKSDGTSEGTVRVKDIQVGTRGSLPRDFVSAGGRVLFTAYSEEFGRELWATNGTEHGTVLVADLAPGAATSTLDSFTPIGETVYFHRDQELWSTDGTDSGTTALTTTAADLLTPFNERLLFRANVGYAEPQLWVSDGTTEGTTILSDEIDPTRLVVADNVAYVLSHGNLWRSDGTIDGTQKLGLLKRGSFPSNALHSTVVGDTIYISLAEELWVSDGTTDGTRKVKAFHDEPRNLTPLGDKIYFSVGRQLWGTDGTIDGTERLKSSSNLGGLTAVGDTIFFSSRRDLWIADGTTDGTRSVKEFERDNTPSITTTFGNRVLFYADHDGRNVLWQSDGSVEGTTPVAGMEHINVSDYTDRDREMNGMLYVTGMNDHGDQELWRTDGSEAGTHFLGVDRWVMTENDESTLIWSTADDDSRGLWAINEGDETASQIQTTIVGPSGGFSTNVVVHDVGGKALYVVNGQLWRSDETQTTRIQAVPEDFHIRSVIDDQLYFVSKSSEDSDPIELWRTDGTNEGTVRLMSDERVTTIGELTGLGGVVFFKGQSQSGNSIWRLDEGQPRAVELPDLEHPPVSINGDVFLFRNGTHGATELWKGNALTEPEELITVIPDGNFDYHIADNQLFLQVRSANSNGIELWRTDGTAEGTYWLTDDMQGDLYRVARDKLFFLKHTEELGQEFWVTDGTVEGTHLTRDIALGSQGCHIYNMVSLDGTVYFDAHDAAGIRGLWKSDGTAEGTVLVQEIDASPVAAGDGVIYFDGFDPSTGRELWKSDGTQEGTVQIADLNPGPDGSRSKYLSSDAATEINGRLYFSANDGFHGNELWQIPLETETPAAPGDANRDGLFDSSDLVQVFQRGEYEDQIEGNSTWEDGDWNGDGDFTTADLVLAFQSGGYQAADLLHASRLDDVLLFDGTDDSDRKKRSTLDPEFIDESFQQRTVMRVSNFSN